MTLFLTRDLAEPPIPSTTPFPCDVAKYFQETLHWNFFDNIDTSFTMYLFLNSEDGPSVQIMSMSPFFKAFIKVKTEFFPLSWLSVIIKNGWQTWLLLYRAAVNKLMHFRDHKAFWTSFWQSQLYAIAKSHCKTWQSLLFLSSVNAVDWIHLILTCSLKKENLLKRSSFNSPTHPCFWSLRRCPVSVFIHSFQKTVPASLFSIVNLFFNWQLTQIPLQQEKSNQDCHHKEC